MADQGWDMHLFPSIDWGVVHPEMRNITVHHSAYGRQTNGGLGIGFRGMPLFYEPAADIMRRLIKKFSPDYRVLQLRRIIDKIKPDIIHSMETQEAGYLTAEVKKLYKKPFPLWVHTIWGSDIYLFGRLSSHKEKIRSVLESCDYLLCECRRDIKSARSFGFRGEAVLLPSAEGGFDFGVCAALRSPHKTSDRRNIMLKGYQGWAGRALVGLGALERCADILKGYEISVFSAGSDVAIAAELFSDATGIPVRVIPSGTSHGEILGLHGKSRLSIGLSISDGVPRSFLEALVMGAFPIQSWTACADEWIEHGKTGILVPPEDPEVVASAIRRALTDDELVNEAARRNYRLAEERLDESILKPKAIEFYYKAARGRGSSH
jgi:glycosyltransferase involved in cell wall biosynthesis